MKRHVLNTEGRVLRCNICDSSLSEPRYNRELKRWEPCHTCLEVIYDCLNDFKDNAVWVEESLDEVLGEADISPNKISDIENST